VGAYLTAEVENMWSFTFLSPLYSFMASTREMFSSYSLYEKIASVLFRGVKTLSWRFLFSKYRTIGRATLRCNLSVAHKKMGLITFYLFSIPTDAHT